MVKWLVVLLIVLSCTSPVQADRTPPPVEIHMMANGVLYMYACYPANITEPPEMAVMVYVNMHDGLAGYLCEYDGGALLIPILPHGNEMVSVPLKWMEP